MSLLEPAFAITCVLLLVCCVIAIVLDKRKKPGLPKPSSQCQRGYTEYAGRR